METIEITVEGSLRADAQNVLAQEGLTLPDAISKFLKTVVHNGNMPIIYRTPNAKTMEAMKEAEEGHLHQASSVAEFMRSLREDD
jgi:addiction module RelB/DinJ family antitoxin